MEPEDWRRVSQPEIVRCCSACSFEGTEGGPIRGWRCNDHGGEERKGERERERGKKGKIEGRDNGQVGERARMKTKEPEWARRKGN